MLTIYRRHRRACAHRGGGRDYRRCHCPIWVDGMLAGQEIRKSLALRDWQKAQELIRQWEAENRIEESTRLTLAAAWDRFLADAEARRLRSGTVAKYKGLRRQMDEFALKRNVVFLDTLDLDALSDFRACIGRANLNRVRAFFRFVFERRWIADNPARALRPPKVALRQTLPFSTEEMRRILGAVEAYGRHAGRAKAQRLRAFVLTLRYSGMRIGDVAQLTVDRIAGNRLFLYTQKTGQAVNVVLPAFVVSALQSCPHGSARHYFWTGQSTVKTAVGLWQRSLKSLFRLAGVKGGHAHRFRDTFAVEFLLAGGTVEQLSVLLGHSSTRITERHYSPWVRARQEQLEALLERSWERDPIALTEAKGTQEVQGPRHVN